MSGYNAPRTVEVYRLPDSANAAIPQDIREQFQRDEDGRVLFFTTPPVDALPPVGEGTVIGHTAKHLANKLRRKMALKEKREAEGLPSDGETPALKKAKVEQEEPSLQRVEDLRDRGLRMMIEQMNQGTEAIYKSVYGDTWEEGMEYEQGRLQVAQAEAAKRQAELEASERKRREGEKVDMYGTGLYLDDYDPRY